MSDSSNSLRDPSEICPFGEALQHYWDRLSPLERQMKLDREALYSLALQSVMIRPATWFTGKRVIDLFCGAGGSSIGIARSGRSVVAVDRAAERIAMAKENALLFGVAEQIEFIQRDALTILREIEGDALYLDPPWGGPEYSKREIFRLEDFAPSGEELLKIAIEREEFREVALRLPKNFQGEELKKWGEWTVEEDLFEGKLLHRTAYWRRG